MTVVRWPDESPAYTKLRDELHEAEVALRDQRERVAELRRQRPGDTPIPDETWCEVRDGVTVELPMSELFTRPERPLVVMHFVYGKAQTSPGSACCCATPTASCATATRCAPFSARPASAAWIC